MSKTFDLHARGWPEAKSILQNDGETDTDTFKRAIEDFDVAADDVFSFWDDGLQSTEWSDSAGRERIYEVRALPILSDDARLILVTRFMSPKASLVLDNQERCFTVQARAAFDELIDAGILTETPADNGYAEARRYALTNMGKTYPRAATLGFVKEHGGFALTEQIETREKDTTPAFDP